MAETHRSFEDFLDDHRDGELRDEVATALAELTAAVRDREKPGSLTLKITVAPVSGSDGVFAVTDQLGVKLPQLPSGKSIFYAEGDGSLVRSDPRQKRLPGMEAAVKADAGKKLQAALDAAGVTATVVLGVGGVEIEVPDRDPTDEEAAALEAEALANDPEGMAAAEASIAERVAVVRVDGEERGASTGEPDHLRVHQQEAGAA